MQVNSINILMNFKEFAYQKLLLEANKEKRIIYLTEKYGKKLKDLLENNNIDPRNYIQSGNIVDVVVERIDPTDGEYSEWIIKHILTIQDERKLRRFFDEDFWAVQEDLTKYHKYKKFFKTAGEDMNNHDTKKLSDINQIKGFDDLYQKLKIIDHYIEKQEEKDEFKNAEKEAVKYYNSDNYLIVSPRTVEASCAYGRNTRWCTAAKEHNYFDHYSRQGELFIIIDKKKNEKYQFHFPSEQYMDSNDDEIDVKEFLNTHKEIKGEIYKLAESARQFDFILMNGGVDWVVKKINEYEPTEVNNFIGNYALMALKIGMNDPELVNKKQDLFKFESDKTITLNSYVNSFLDLTTFIHEDHQGSAYHILQGDYSYYTSGSLEMVQDDSQYDWLDKHSVQILKKYIYNSYNREINDVEDMKEFIHRIDDTYITELLALSYTAACEADLHDKYYKEVVDTIVSAISPINKKYKFDENGIIVFPGFTPRGIENIIEDMNPVVGPNKHFFGKWAGYLEERGELYRLNLDRITPDPSLEEYGEAFNTYFQEEIVSMIPKSKQMELDLSSINRDMTTRFDAFIKKIFQEGIDLGNMGPKPSQGTQPITPTSNTPKQVTGGVKPKFSNKPINTQKPMGGTTQKPMDYGAILTDPTAFELFQSDPQNIEGFRQHMADPKNFANLQKSIKDPNAWTTVAQLLASPQQ